MYACMAIYYILYCMHNISLYGNAKRVCLRNSMGFVHTSPLQRLPSDVTLKLSDGSIKAQKMMLACVSPVFEKMFYRNFKESKSKVIELRT